MFDDTGGQRRDLDDIVQSNETSRQEVYDMAFSCSQETPKKEASPKQWNSVNKRKQKITRKTSNQLQALERFFKTY